MKGLKARGPVSEKLNGFMPFHLETSFDAGLHEGSRASPLTDCTSKLEGTNVSEQESGGL